MPLNTNQSKGKINAPNARRRGCPKGIRAAFCFPKSFRQPPRPVPGDIIARCPYFNSTETLKKRLVERKAASARPGERAQFCALSTGLPRSV